MATKIDLRELYKQDWESLEPFVDDIKTTYRTRTTTRLSRQQLQTMKEIHDKYYSTDKAKLSGCGKCIMKLVDRVYQIIKNSGKL